MGDEADRINEPDYEYEDEHEEGHSCPDCGGWKGTSYDVCRDCSNDRASAAVLVRFHKILRETPKALLLKLAPGFVGREVWIPKSLIGDDLEPTRGELLAPRWWAEENQIPHEES